MCSSDDEEGRRLLAGFEACRTAADKLSKLTRSMLYPEYKQLTDKVETLRLECNEKLCALRVHRKQMGDKKKGDPDPSMSPSPPSDLNIANSFPRKLDMKPSCELTMQWHEHERNKTVTRYSGEDGLLYEFVEEGGWYVVGRVD
jgi:hypothetical protein